MKFSHQQQSTFVHTDRTLEGLEKQGPFSHPHLFPHLPTWLWGRAVARQNLSSSISDISYPFLVGVWMPNWQDAKTSCQLLLGVRMPKGSKLQVDYRVSTCVLPVLFICPPPFSVGHSCVRLCTKVLSSRTCTLVCGPRQAVLKCTLYISKNSNWALSVATE